MSSAKSTARGTKRRCQSAECGVPFYDLNRTEMNCPVCGAEFDLAAAMRIVPTVPARAVARRGGRPVAVAAPVIDLPRAESDDALDAVDAVEAVDIEADAGEDTGAEVATVETILDDEDEDSVEAIVDVLPEDEDRRDD